LAWAPVPVCLRPWRGCRRSRLPGPCSSGAGITSLGIFLDEAKLAVADRNHVLVAQQQLGDLSLVHEGAVGAAEVFDDVEIAATDDYRMLVVGIDIAEGNLIGRLAADDHPVLVDREFPET
jgi:hypothetical protein